VGFGVMKGEGVMDKKAMKRRISELEAQLEDVEDLVVGVFRRDKTPMYGYGGKANSQDKYGNLPEGVGKRWATPRELAQDYAKRHGFERELWDRKDGP